MLARDFPIETRGVTLAVTRRRKASNCSLYEDHSRSFELNPWRPFSKRPRRPGLLPQSSMACDRYLTCLGQLALIATPRASYAVSGARDLRGRPPSLPLARAAVAFATVAALPPTAPIFVIH